MSRIVKEAEVRRMEIVEISKSLFEKNGFENTSVENIIRSANIAKGTFYYYFKTKNDVLDEVVKYISDSVYNLLDSIANSESISAMDKLTQIFVGDDKKSIVNTGIMQSIHAIENRTLQEKLNIYYIERIIPLITEVFNQGYTAKLWSKKTSVQSMQIVLGGSQFILDSGLFTLDKKERSAFFTEIENLLECLLGATPGTFTTIFNELKQQ